MKNKLLINNAHTVFEKKDDKYARRYVLKIINDSWEEVSK